MRIVLFARFYFNLRSKERDKKELLLDLTPEEKARFKKTKMEIAKKGKGKRMHDEAADGSPSRKTKTMEASA